MGFFEQASREPFAGSHWEAERDGTKLTIDCEEATFDAGRRGERPRVNGDATGGLLWRHLVRQL